MRYDFSRKFKLNDDDDTEYLYARGILTIEVIGLTKTVTGKFVVPTFKIDEKGNMQNFFLKDGKPIPLYTFKNGKETLLEQPEMEGKTKEKKLLLWCDEKGNSNFYRLEAWEYLAKKLNMFYKKGDEVVILAHKVKSKGAESGQSEDIWVIQDICKIKKDNDIKKTKNKENSHFEESTEDMLPFN